MFDQDSLTRASELPGYLGPLAESHPSITRAWITPFIWANLLYLGEVRACELEGQLSQIVPIDDLRVGAWDALTGRDDVDRNKLQIRLDEALAEEVAAGRIVYDEASDHYRISDGDGLRMAISAVCTFNSQLPFQLLDSQAALQVPAPF